MTITEKPVKVSTAESVYKIMSAILEREEGIDQEKEHFWVIGLNGRLVTKYIELVSLGTLNQSLVHPREVFRLAIMKGVASILLCHNHPSNAVDPSEDDLIITKRLVEAGKLLGIELIDHIIIGQPHNEDYKPLYLSLKEKGVI